VAALVRERLGALLKQHRLEPDPRRDPPPPAAVRLHVRKYAVNRLLELNAWQSQESADVASAATSVSPVRQLRLAETTGSPMPIVRIEQENRVIDGRIKEFNRRKQELACSLMDRSLLATAF
jgi:hypothetical protein